MRTVAIAALALAATVSARRKNEVKRLATVKEVRSSLSHAHWAVWAVARWWHWQQHRVASAL